MRCRHLGRSVGWTRGHAGVEEVSSAPHPTQRRRVAVAVAVVAAVAVADGQGCQNLMNARFRC